MDRDFVQSTVSEMTDLLRILAVPPVASNDASTRVASVRRYLCRQLEPLVCHALTTLRLVEELEADRAVFVATGDGKRAQDLMRRIFDVLDHEEREASRPRGSSPRRTRSGRVEHGTGFCSAVSSKSPKGGKRCLPTPSRGRSADAPSTPVKMVHTKTGLTSTPPARKDPPPSSVRSRSKTRHPDGSTPTKPVSTPHSNPSTPLAIGRSHPPSSTPPRSAHTHASRLHPGVSVSPPRPTTPIRSLEGPLDLVSGFSRMNPPSSPTTLPRTIYPSASSRTTSPRRDREFVVALLRSLHLEQYAERFANMSLLSFYQLTPRELSSFGMSPRAQATLSLSIDQIKHMAESQALRSPIALRHR
ncbi:hypothetical protein DIPPA_22767 [Diplonema papillatum]|nr:hypothetical protein DIPPA_22767 [Diplonema papillatum]